MTWIKICGVTNVDDAEHVVRTGANAIGLNFVHGSKRRVTVEQALPMSVPWIQVTPGPVSAARRRV